MSEIEQNENILVSKYKTGKIYTIRSHKTDKYYIGSTYQPLHKRFYQHKCHYNKNHCEGLTSKIIFNYGDAYIELLELFSCNNKIELDRREGELIRLHKDKCVNIMVAGRTNKEWHIDNTEYQKIKNAERFQIKRTGENREQYLKYKKEQYENNNKIKIKCDICEVEITKHSLNRHKKRLH